MIRINLLEETRVAAAKGKTGGGLTLPKFEVAENVPVMILGAGVGMAILAVALAWLYHQRLISNLDSQIEEQKREKAKLEFVFKQNEELDHKKAELERKIKVIQDLKTKQAGPVKMLDQISRSLADDCWLERLDFTDPQVDIAGKAVTPLAFSKFLGNLESNPYFNGVEMVEQVYEPSTNLTTFSLKANFSPPAPPAEAKPAAAVPTTTSTAPPAGPGSNP